MSSKNTTLIITEKPQAAAKIASALSGETDEKVDTKEGVSYFEFHKGSRKYIVGCAVGHLFGIGQKVTRGPFPNFDVEWQPAYQKKSGEFTKRYLTVLKKLAKDADEFIIATDFDVEGEVIGWNVIRFVCGQKDAKRMKFSLLTTEALVESFKNVLPHLNWGAAYAGETRHYIDWFYGINLSRGLMKALSSTGTFRILSIGRVQGPALKIVSDREKEIMEFKSEPFWQVFLQVKDIKNQKEEVKYPKDIFEEKELLKFKHLKGKKGEAVTKFSTENVPAPTPFDLTTLQTEAYKNHGYTPTQTLKIAQKLYLAGAISYPRTSSQKYAESIGYDIIFKRFISCFCDEAILDNKKLEVEVNALKFHAKGVKIKENGWMNVYPHSTKESDIATMNGPVDVTEIRMEEKMTKPPKRYSAASLVKELEKRGLGTKATRASIVETLYSRGYVREKSIEVTELGLRMVDTLEKYSPVILDEKMTKEMTDELESIEVLKSGWLDKEKKILDNEKKTVVKIAEQMTTHMKAMGESLKDANEAVWEQEKEENTMSECPVCHDGKLRVMYGKKFSRYFVSCDNYPKCKTIYSLPAKGMMKPARVSKSVSEEGEDEEKDSEANLEKCVECGFPMVLSFQRGRAPWKYCFNPKCPSNEENEKRKQEFKDKIKSGEIEIGADGKVIDHTKKEGEVKSSDEKFADNMNEDFGKKKKGVKKVVKKGVSKKKVKKVGKKV